MPKRFKKNKKNGSKRKGKRRSKAFSSSSTRFTGPIHQRQKDDVITANMVNGTIMSVAFTGGAWSYNPVFETSTVTGLSDFSSYAGLYQEYRVIGMSVLWVPALENSTPANSPITNASPMFLCPDEQEQTALTGDIAAFQHEGKRMGSLTKTVKCSIKAKEVTSSIWQLTSTGGTNNMAIKCWINGTASTSTGAVTIGHFYTEYAVQFRYRVITSTSISSTTTQQQEEKKMQRIGNQIDCKIPPQLQQIADVQCTKDVDKKDQPQHEAAGKWIYVNAKTAEKEQKDNKK